MIALVIGLAALFFALVMGLFAVVMAVQNPLEGLIVLLPAFLVVLYGIRRINGRERLRRAILVHNLQETKRFRRF